MANRQNVRASHLEEMGGDLGPFRIFFFHLISSTGAVPARAVFVCWNGKGGITNVRIIASLYPTQTVTQSGN
jgi:hypothetical protein